MQLPDPALTLLNPLKPSCDPWASNKEPGMSAVLIPESLGRQVRLYQIRWHHAPPLEQGTHNTAEMQHNA